MYYSKYVDYFFNLNSLDKIAAQIVNEIDFKNMYVLFISQLSNSLKIKFFDNKYFMMLHRNKSQQKKLKMISLFRVFRQIIAFIVSLKAIP